MMFGYAQVTGAASFFVLQVCLFLFPKLHHKKDTADGTVLLPRLSGAEGSAQHD
jgi:hypothetical protein